MFEYESLYIFFAIVCGLLTHTNTLTHDTESHHYGSEIDIWSIGCLFAEMKLTPHVPLFPGKDVDGGLHQLELIYQLLGTPAPGSSVELEYQEIVQKNNRSLSESLHARITRPYLNMLKQRFHMFDSHSLHLLERLLDLHPKNRITAEAALDCEYFWNDPAPLAENLKTFEVAAAFSMTEDARVRAEYQARQEEIMRNSQQQQAAGASVTVTAASGASQQHFSSSQQRGGRGGGGFVHQPRPRAIAPSKYSITKPTK